MVVISKAELEVIKRLFSTLSDNDRESFLKSIKSKEGYIFTKELKECPHCKSTHSVKNGKTQGKQELMCATRHKTSIYIINGTVLYRVKKVLSAWKKYVYRIIEKCPLRETTKICDISLSAIFAWRHKILNILQEMQGSIKLNDIVEADKIFISNSCKGNHKDFNFPCLSKKRGSADTGYKLFKELVYISCVVNLNDKSIAKIANLSKPNIKALNSIINGKVEKKSVFITNSPRSYLKPSNELKLDHIKISLNKHGNRSSNIRMVIFYHSILKLYCFMLSKVYQQSISMTVSFITTL